MPGGPYHAPSPACPGLLGRDGDGHVRAPVNHRGDELGAGRGRVPQVGVDKEQEPGRAVLVVAHGHDAGAGLQGGGLAPAHRVAHGHRPGAAGVVLGGVGRAVVDDDDEVHPGDSTAGAHGGCDALSLILGGDDDSDMDSGHAHHASLATHSDPQVIPLARSQGARPQARPTIVMNITISEDREDLRPLKRRETVTET